MPERNSSSSRIKFAWHNASWQRETGDVHDLRTFGITVLPTEYQEFMKGHLFCPSCFTDVYRTPHDKPVFANGRKACFAHFGRYREIACDLRSTKPEGKHYSSEEEASQAIAAENLIVVSAFQTEPPTTQGLSSGTYGQSAVEDSDGPIASVPINRHHGEPFRLPTRLTTVNSICRNFDENLLRYYVLPGSNAAVRLMDALRNVASVEAADDVPRLYFGRIKSSHNAGKHATNVRMTWLEHSSSVVDFCIKDTHAVQQEKGITDAAKGRLVLIWGRVTESGVGLCFTRLGWGEYALLPPRYNSLLDD